MRTHLRTLLAIALIACATAVSHAEVTAQGGLDIYSKYIWRGFNLCDNLVWQPSVTLSANDWELGIWSNLDGGDGGRCTELDATISRTFQLGPNQAVAGFTYYTFPNLDENNTSQEVFAAVTYPTRVPLSLTAYYDWDEGDGLYLELATEVPLPALGADDTLTLALGYNRHQWREDSGLSHTLITYTHPIASGRATLAPTIGYSIALADDLENELFYGLTGAIPF